MRPDDRFQSRFTGRIAGIFLFCCALGVAYAAELPLIARQADDFNTLDLSGVTIDDTGTTLTITPVLVAESIVLDADLEALAALASTGIVVRTGAGTYALRTITGDSEIVVSDGDGVSGNPTLSIGADIARDSEITAAIGAIVLSDLSDNATTASEATYTAGSGLTPHFVQTSSDVDSIRISRDVASIGSETDFGGIAFWSEDVDLDSARIRAIGDSTHDGTQRASRIEIWTSAATGGPQWSWYVDRNGTTRQRGNFEIGTTSDRNVIAPHGSVSGIVELTLPNTEATSQTLLKGLGTASGGTFWGNSFISVLTTLPGSPVAGELVYATDTGTISLRDSTNSSWLNTGLTSSHDPVTLAGQDYLGLSGQQITAGLIDLTDDVTGELPAANLVDEFLRNDGDTGSGTYQLGTLGVGVSPSQLLHVQSGSASAARIRISETGDTASTHFAGLALYDSTTFKGGYFKQGDNHTTVFYDATTPRIHIYQQGEVVVNENSQDRDFRVESDANENLLVVNGGTSTVGIGDASPTEPLTVAGDVAIYSGTLNINDTEASSVAYNSIGQGSPTMGITNFDDLYIEDNLWVDGTAVVSEDINVGDDLTVADDVFEQNNWQVSGWRVQTLTPSSGANVTITVASGNMVRVDASGTNNLTAITDGRFSGEMLTISMFSSTSDDLVISGIAGQLSVPSGGITLNEHDTALFQWDVTSSIWRLVSTSQNLVTT